MNSLSVSTETTGLRGRSATRAALHRALWMRSLDIDKLNVPIEIDDELCIPKDETHAVPTTHPVSPDQAMPEGQVPGTKAGCRSKRVGGVKREGVVGLSRSDPTFSTAANEPAHERLAHALESRDIEGVVSAAWTLHWHGLYAFFRSRGESDLDARDCIQDTFSHVVEWWESFQGDRFSGWLFTIARYAWYSHQAKVRRDLRRQYLVPPRDHVEPSLDVTFDRKEQLTLVLRVVNSLDPVDQVIFHATFWDGCDPHQIAERLQSAFNRPYSLEAIRMRRHRVRMRIAHYLARKNTVNKVDSR